jgi:hypothetical protein
MAIGMSEGGGESGKSNDIVQKYICYVQIFFAEENIFQS